jgi:hypothetical protein
MVGWFCFGLKILRPFLSVKRFDMPVICQLYASYMPNHIIRRVSRDSSGCILFVEHQCLGIHAQYQKVTMLIKPLFQKLECGIFCILNLIPPPISVRRLLRAQIKLMAWESAGCS